MKRILHAIFFISLVGTAGASEPQRVDMADEEIFEVLRYLYRWHLDAWVYSSAEPAEEGVALLKELEVDHDEGDASRYVELVIPVLQVRVSLKKADYEIPELGLAVRNDQFKVWSVQRSREPLSIEEPDSYEHRTLKVADVWEYLHRTRNDRIFPDEVVRRRLGDALRGYFENLSPAEQPEVDLAAPQLFYVAPLSPVSNDLWVFWENARRLIKFSSDADYESEAFWLMGPLHLEVFDLDRDVVVTADETEGGATVVTKDWVGRTLYNCIVLGQKLTVSPASEDAGRREP